MTVQRARELGSPFLTARAPSDATYLMGLHDSPDRLAIGRRDKSDVPLTWDDKASRTHAELARIGGDWVISDDGISLNGTFVNGTRVRSRHILRDGDTVRIGRTWITFHSPLPDEDRTAIDSEAMVVDSLTPAQRRVLSALAEPIAADAAATPATNEQIAAAVHLSVSAVKSHLGALFLLFGVADLPQNQKRAALARLALESGAATADR